MTEKWLPVVSWEGVYEVSNMGRLRSLERFRRGVNNSQCKIKEKILSLHLTKKHWTVMLSQGERKERLYIHRLVLLAFVGIPQDGYEACHFDGNSANNCLTNLRWDTRSANHQDKNRHGTMMKGEVWREKHKWMLGKGSRKNWGKTSHHADIRLSALHDE